MTIHPVRMAGAVCAALTALLLVSISAPAAAQSRDTRMTLAPSVQNAPNATSLRVASPTRVATSNQRVRKSNRMPHWNTYTTGTPDLAFLSAEQHLALAAYEGVVWMVAENEFSLLDFAAGDIRVVEPDELSEIDLANDPATMLAQMQPIEQAAPAQQLTAAEPAKPEEEDGILNRILMTFAGALALAGAMKLLIA